MIFILRTQFIDFFVILHNIFYFIQYSDIG